MNALYAFWHEMAAHLWQTTVIIALVLLLDAALRNAPSRARHTLWSIGLAKIFLPLSLFGGLANAVVRTVAGAEPMAREGAVAQVLPVVTAVLDPIGRGAAPAPGSTLSYVLVAATACWISFALYFAGRIVADTIRMGRHGGKAISTREGGAAGRLAAVLDDAGIPRDRVVLCHRLVTPSVVGLLRPVILVPEHLVASLADEELRAIVLHEEAHRRRRDPLRAALLRASLALFFFYPLLYPVLRRLRFTAECACDESVVHAGVPADTYVRALARTLSLGLASTGFAGATAAGESFLGRRFARLSTLDPRRYAMRLQYRVLIAAAALVVAAATILPLPTNATGDQEKKASQQEAKNNTANIKISAGEEKQAKIELVNRTNPVYPEEARKLGVVSKVFLRFKIAGAKGGQMTVTAAVDSLVMMPPEGASIDKDTMKRLRAQFEKNALEAAGAWTFNVDATGIESDTIDVIVPVTYELH